ncbi:MAG: VWA domain-containing protein [Thioploca sp.]|nr:VWA domain-containing protein [Thioploca sp.]
MKVTATLNYPAIALNQPHSIDLLLDFNADNAQFRQKRPPLNLSMVIDRSGSMVGQPLKNAIKSALLCIEHLTVEDILSIVVYDDEVDTLFSPQPVLNKDIVRTVIKQIQAGGCTNLSGGWLRGCEHVQSHLNKSMIHRVLLLTDGQANVGITDMKVLVKTAQQKAIEGVATTTLGFGSHFNEDLLINMATAGGGNFYFIQSPDDMAEVFRIELDSLGNLVAQDLTVILQPNHPVSVNAVLNNYPQHFTDQGVEVKLGDIYENEGKNLVVNLTLPPYPQLGIIPILQMNYRYQAIVADIIQQHTDHLMVTLPVVTAQEAQTIKPNLNVIEQASRLRVAQVKDEAIHLADDGDFQIASQKLRDMITYLTLTPLQDNFEITEEMDQLDYYAQQIETGRYNPTFRKEMRDQSYQSRTRKRGDLKLRGLTEGSAHELETTTSAESGVLVQCLREQGKLRIKVISPGYHPDFHVQFPRRLREEGVTYVVDEITASVDNKFYRSAGKIRRLIVPEQEQLYLQRHTVSQTRSKSKPKAVTAPSTAADLETTDIVGTGVLIQCVPEGKKLRARIVSDGYDPNYNVRFPRSIRELGILYVVDEVIEGPGGGSYIACGKVRRLVQT